MTASAAKDRRHAEGDQPESSRSRPNGRIEVGFHSFYSLSRENRTRGSTQRTPLVVGRANDLERLAVPNVVSKCGLVGA